MRDSGRGNAAGAAETEISGSGLVGLMALSWAALRMPSLASLMKRLMDHGEFAGPEYMEHFIEPLRHMRLRMEQGSLLNRLGKCRAHWSAARSREDSESTDTRMGYLS